MAGVSIAWWASDERGPPLPVESTTPRSSRRSLLLVWNGGGRVFEGDGEGGGGSTGVSVAEWLSSGSPVCSMGGSWMSQSERSRTEGVPAHLPRRSVIESESSTAHGAKGRARRARRQGR